MKYILYAIVIIFLVLCAYLFKQQYLISSQSVKEQSAEASNNMAHASAEVKQVNNSLVVKYSIKNTSDSDLYIYNKLPTSWKNDMQEHTAYVLVDSGRTIIMVGDAGLKGLNSQVIPNLFWRPMADKTTIKAGDTFTDTINISLPLKENQIIYPEDGKPEYYKQQTKSLTVKIEVQKSTDTNSEFIELPFESSLVVDTIR